MSKRKVSESMKKRVAGDQFFKCANRPESNVIPGYKCPLWAKSDDNRGIFDAAGYEIDHIEEFCINNNDLINNLQALCLSCHSVKTKNFLRTLNPNRNDKTIMEKSNNTSKIKNKKCVINNIDDDDTS